MHWNTKLLGGARRFAPCLLGLVAALGAIAAAAEHTTYVVSIPETSPAALARVEAAGGVIDHVNGSAARAYVHISHWDTFRAAGIPFTLLEIQPPAVKQLNGYPDYAEISAIVQEAAENYPEIVRIGSLGRSVQGRALWALRITDNPDVEEDKPEFAYIATMHGDEPVGTVLCLNFLDELLAGYGADPAITAYIDETEIWIVPLMNPDGYELGIRWNANNADLNRSFPVFPGDFTGTIFSSGLPGTAGREPEVAHVMNWTAENSLALVGNFHTGALVVNYPYDEEPGIASGSDAPTPDDGLMRDLSSAYARLNPPMFNSARFPGGITNGSAWFSIAGGMQDWHYRYTAAIDLTIEVSDVKAPDPALLPALWEDNRAAMFALLAQVHQGARGLVTDRITGAPLYARVLVDENPQPVFTDPDVGDYHRLLQPGAYTLRAEAPGYIPYTADDITVTEGAAARADMTLSTGDVNRDGAVNVADLQLVINAVLGLNTLPDADVDGGGVTATDVQHLVNRVLHR